MIDKIILPNFKIKNSFVFIAILLIALMNISAIHATIYYVAPDGNDLNSGTSLTFPWKTLDKANFVLQPGDTVLIRGGIYTGQQIAPARSGNETNRIVYKNYNDEKVRIENSQLGVILSSRSYITVHGIEIFYCKKYMKMDNAHYNHVQYCVFDSAKNNTSFTGIAVGGPNASYNWIHHCSISRYGGDTNENGDMLSLEGKVPNPGYVHHNLIENNHIFQGRHNLIATSGQYNIIRNNYFHSEEWDEGGLYGGRLAEIKGTRETSNWNLLEGNRFAFSGTGDARASSPGIKLVSPDNIFRFNFVYACKGPGIQVVTHVSDGPYGSDNNYIFHNVIFHNGLDPDGPYGLWFRNGSVNTTVVKNNIFYDNPTHIGSPGSNIFENNWLVGDPHFVDAEVHLLESANADYPDFNLQEASGCIDAGAFLTRTINAGSGTAIAVENAHYFIDGWGIVDGDFIQLEGQNEAVQITNIDYENNIITVDEVIEWNTGVGVTFPFNCKSPDIGALESIYENEKKKFSLIVNILGNGAVTRSPDNTAYSPGTVVTLTAEADSGEQFIEWGGALTGTDNPQQITFDTDKSVNAIFSSFTSRITEDFVIEAIEPQSGQFEVTWNVYVTADKVDGVIGFSHGIPDNYNDLSYKILFNNNGKITVSNGTAYTSDYDVGYLANQHFTFRMYVDLDAQTYSVWITPEGQNEILLADTYQFHPAPDVIDSIKYRSVKMSFDPQWGGAEGMIEISAFNILAAIDSESNKPQHPFRYSFVSFPNPFNPNATICYSLHKSGNVDLTVFDITGRKVADLFHGFQEAGDYTVTWYATEVNSRQIASGIYFCMLKHKQYKLIKKMTLVR